MEHRWGERSKLNIPVQIDCGPRGTVLGVMRDASASGAFLCTAAQIPLWTHVRVGFAGAPSYSVEAQVVRRAADGFGLEWAELAPRAIVDLLTALHLTAMPQQPQIRTTVPIVGSAADSAAPAAGVATAEEITAGPILS